MLGVARMEAALYFGRRGFKLGQQDLNNGGYRYLGVYSPFLLPCVSNVAHEICKQYSP